MKTTALNYEILTTSMAEPASTISAVSEHAVNFHCHGSPLIGVLSLPQDPLATAVVIVVGGPQYRVGSHRQFVLLSRRLASHGFATLRFDMRGMGDSGGATVSFSDSSDDLDSAASAVMERCPAIKRLVFWGLCDGASAALLYWHRTRDPRLAGMVLANPWVRAEETHARATVKHYYFRRMAQAEFWRKLGRGGIGFGALLGLLANVRRGFGPGYAPSGVQSQSLRFQDRMAAAWREFPGKTLVILSGRDLTAREFEELSQSDPAWKGVLSTSQVECIRLAEADHTFSSPEMQRSMHTTTLRWLCEFERHPTRPS